jgi:hypothetical protein
LADGVDCRGGAIAEDATAWNPEIRAGRTTTWNRDKRCRTGRKETAIRRYTLETIIIVLVVIWLLGWLILPLARGLIHLLLIVILVIVLIRLLRGRGPFG